MEIRCGSKKMDDKTKKYVHMLNATLTATTRTLCCILENYQTKTGVTVPEVLVPYMGGTTFLPFTRAAPVNMNKAKMERAAVRKEGVAAAAAAATTGGASAEAGTVPLASV